MKTKDILFIESKEPVHIPTGLLFDPPVKWKKFALTLNASSMSTKVANVQIPDIILQFLEEVGKIVAHNGISTQPRN